MKFTAEMKQKLLEEMRELLHEYDYETTDSALEKILDTWFTNKKDLIEILEKHPNWNSEKLHIAFDQDYERKIDGNVVWSTFNHIEKIYRQSYLLEKIIVDGIDCDEAEERYCKADWIRNVFRNSRIDAATTVINGINEEEANRRCNEEKELYLKFNGRRFTEESIKKENDFFSICSFFKYYAEETLNERAVEAIQRYCPSVRVAKGQKTSRAMNKVLKHFGVDTWTEDDGSVQYNKLFATYSDAINTLAIVRHTVISVNPIDYLTMSFGNSWASCHTIDKKNKRNRGGDGYSGCYSSGTISYMLDPSSFVFYTVDKQYNGVDYELQDKINRNMFHFYEEKLIQGRVYPQCNDGDNGLYRKFREIVQKVLADCLEAPNMWKNICYGGDDMEEYVEDEGTHYRDYTNYESCNLSTLAGYGSSGYVYIGHSPICVNTGEEHNCETTVQPY